MKLIKEVLRILKIGAAVMCMSFTVLGCFALGCGWTPFYIGWGACAIITLFIIANENLKK